ncbi:MAG: hypothetical protein NZ902_04555 [Acidilobaceae archaeon]|nr:hypothetical protein [Acidilobaceae archaeon]MCX8164999.1 hypothetical protein [Acidilobaceae archaeon]MDW7974484.1 hypothetical protein [Sulfolobales archaeon]
MGDVKEEIEESCREDEEKRGDRLRAIARRLVAIDLEKGFWAYVGRERDHFLIEGLYCSCSSFALSLTKRAGCEHLSALRVAKRSGAVRELKVDVASVVWEIVSVGLSPTLRKALLEQQMGEDYEKGEGSRYDED